VTRIKELEAALENDRGTSLWYWQLADHYRCIFELYHMNAKGLFSHSKVAVSTFSWRMKFQAQGALKAVEIADRCESATRPRMAGVESSHKPVEEPEGSAAALDEPFGDSTDGEF
jgi:hypothetical protein